ncbi:hypothetical protein [Candidimonas nitroreducens]|uniref:DUF3108 domain-containing protein n=1 Tax=Candidimonas nitroreducens TaxID=683354 RepID=A0A225MT65_9BURK|nr:hypothetical protein [Candidimonas nitroreducens]OWT61849.1 hypothetical protein CEY11_08425 [Candidimonas nitroreducens]
MSRLWCAGVVVMAGWIGLAASARADVCAAPFMHDGGHVRLVGSGAMQLGADVHFSEVRKAAAGACQARVQGSASFSLAGLPPGKSKIDYWMSVRKGYAHFERRDDSGQRVPMNGGFDLRMLGLFAYGQPITHAGQTFPALKFRVHIDRQAQPLSVSTGVKTVGQRERIQTARGPQSCWPVRYQRVTDPTQASFNGLVLPIPGMRAAVTDWFCPALHMVMKQESSQQGLNSELKVTNLE